MDRPSSAYWDLGLLVGTVALVSYGLYRVVRGPVGTSSSSQFGNDVLGRAKADLGVKEEAENGGVRVDQMLRNVGQGTGVNWCAAAVGTWILEAARGDEVKPPISGSASARATGDQMKNGSPKTVWYDAEILRQRPDLVQPGMVVIWSRGAADSRLGHIGIVSAVTKTGFRSIEGNSGPKADGVYEWDHDLFSSALVGMGGWVDSPIFSDPAPIVAVGVGYTQDPPGAALFNDVAPELDTAPQTAAAVGGRSDAENVASSTIPGFLGTSMENRWKRLLDRKPDLKAKYGMGAAGVARAVLWVWNGSWAQVADVTYPEPFLDLVNAFNTYPNDWRWLWSFDGECTVTRAECQPGVVMRTSGEGGSPTDIQFVNYSLESVQPYLYFADPLC